MYGLIKKTIANLTQVVHIDEKREVAANQSE